MKKQSPCHYCEGKGYIEIRDCTGEIQREETCVFCGGMGQVDSQKVAHDNLGKSINSPQNLYTANKLQQTNLNLHPSPQ